ncbi:MAG: transposase, partial [Planctomycetaceae bacterium]
MPRQNRSNVFDASEIGTYHLLNRCVRQTRLFGIDEVSGVSYEHRKGWLEHRLALLSSAMAVDVLGFCVMSNHIHAIVRNRPDVAAEWSPAEIARRWLIIYPPSGGSSKKSTRPGGTSPEELREAAYRKAVAAIVKDPERVEELRTQLASLSWFMKCLTEKVARDANREDGVTGRFWEGRFKIHRLLDELAVMACMAYVDLNPIRAGLADGLLSSHHTSIFTRLSGAMHQLFEQLDPEERAERGVEESFLNHFLQLSQALPKSSPSAVVPSLPVAQEGETAVSANPLQTLPGSAIPRQVLDEASRQSAFKPLSAWLSPLQITQDRTPQAVPPARASNLGCLEMTLSQYIELLEWTGRQFRRGSAGSIPTDAPSVLQSLQLDAKSWLKLVQGFRG